MASGATGPMRAGRREGEEGKDGGGAHGKKEGEGGGAGMSSSHPFS